jgi:carbon-monoxide dehydrogenase small subunit
MTTTTITLRINGKSHQVAVEPGDLLVNVLRDKLRLPGTKKGCGTGHCGACTVLLDGDQPTLSCLTLAVAAADRPITTVEGLSTNGHLHPLQQAFVDEGAVQCGYCTPGMLMAAKALLAANHNPTEAEILDGIAGNLCRCTGYLKIIAAIRAAAKKMEAHHE